jgi:hypothetical protein
MKTACIFIAILFAAFLYADEKKDLIVACGSIRNGECC